MFGGKSEVSPDGSTKVLAFCDMGKSFVAAGETRKIVLRSAIKLEGRSTPLSWTFSHRHWRFFFVFRY
jgi:hypothetical protein